MKDFDDEAFQKYLYDEWERHVADIESQSERDESMIPEDIEEFFKNSEL